MFDGEKKYYPFSLKTPLTVGLGTAAGVCQAQGGPHHRKKYNLHD